MTKENKGNPEIAGSFFHTSDYQKNNSLASGLATTHEQVSDTYAEGVIDDVNGKDK